MVDNFEDIIVEAIELCSCKADNYNDFFKHRLDNL